MPGSTSHSLQIFDDPSLSGSSEQRALDAPSGFSAAERGWAEMLACRETWRLHPGRRRTSDHEPYSLAWFQQIERRRYERHGRWIPRLLEFQRHPAEKVLCLGDGLGSDWVRFAEGGAQVHYCSASAEQLAIVRRNFALRSAAGRFFHGPTSSLPIGNDEMDVVCLTGQSAAEPIEQVIGEIYRVLRPGGKVLAVLPAHYNSRWWQNFWFPWNRWLDKSDRRDEKLYSAAELKRLFARFADHGFYKRHLRRSELPHIWRVMLLPFLERIMGRFLVLKAFKPVSSAIPAASAAA